MQKSKKFFFLGVLTFLIGAAILWLLYHESSPSGQDNGGASRTNTPAVSQAPGVSVSPNLQQTSATPEPTVATEEMSKITSSIDKALQEEFAEEGEMLSRVTFYAQHNAGLLKWRRYSEVRQEWAKELGDEGVASVESALEQGRQLMDEFWSQGDLSNPEGWKLIYKARFLAEQALAKYGNSDERLWTLLEDSIISAAPADCPYSQRGGAKFNQQSYEIRQEALKDIYKVSVRHFLNLISQKPLQSVTPHDVAVANRVLRASMTTSIRELMFMEPEVGNMAGIDHEQLIKLSGYAVGRELQAKQPKALESLRRRAAEWMVGACESQGWTALKQEAQQALAAVERGERVPPYPMVYRQNILSKFPKDHDAFLRYERFFDGFAMEYRGEPTHVPRI